MRGELKLRNIPFLNRYGALVALVPIIAYWPLVAFPYLLLDDNWLVRPGNPGYPSRKFIALSQGRPILALVSKAWEPLFSEFGLTSIALLRALGLICVLLSGLLLFHLLNTQGQIPVALSVICSSVFLTTPSIQILVANGSWILPGLLTAMLGVHVLLKDEMRYRLILGSTLTLVSIATYQSFGFAMAALILAILAVRGPIALRKTGFALAILISTFLVYYILWRFAYRVLNAQVHNIYNPMFSLSLDAVVSKAIDSVKYRPKMIFGFFAPNTNGSMARPVVIIAQVCLIGIVVLQIACQILKRRVSSHKFYATLVSILAAIAALAVGETLIWFTSAWLSYTTMIGLTLSWLVLVTGVFHKVVRRRSSFRKIGWGSATIVLIFTIIASHGVVTAFSLPLWVNQQRVLEYATDRIDASKSDGSGQVISCIIADIGSGADPNYGIGEFSWTNAQPFYSYWNMRTLLSMSGRDNDTISEILVDPEGNLLSQVGEGDFKKLCVTNDFLDLSSPSKSDLARLTGLSKVRSESKP